MNRHTEDACLPASKAIGPNHSEKHSFVPPHKDLPGANNSNDSGKGTTFISNIQ